MLPVTDSNLRPDALIAEVQRHYPVSDIVRCRLHARGLNDTYKVELSDDGSYFLRVYRWNWRSRDEIGAELAILRHLARQGVKISVPVARRDGDMMTALDCLEGRRWAVLFTTAPGKEIEFKTYTEEQASLYGGAAGAIHHAADGFEGRRFRPRLDLAQLLEQPLARIVSAISQRPDDVSYVSELVRGLRQQIDDATELELGFCHGDFHGQNACESAGTLTFYDFDCCGWGYRAYDLAVFPWAFALGESEPQRIEAMGRAFLRGYAQHRAIGARDISMIPAFVAVRQIWYMGLHLDLADRFGWGWLNDRYFDRHLRILREWERRFLNRPSVEWLLSPAGV